ncbi:MAG: hypothetical protein HDQ88_07545 [Clostridia bacterium]|nr:hypothetical protein [Clostridia bacterium]
MGELVDDEYYGPINDKEIAEAYGIYGIFDDNDTDIITEDDDNDDW